eukprot:1280718-Amorphochlora_amoeboformis.AAC.1
MCIFVYVLAPAFTLDTAHLDYNGYVLSVLGIWRDAGAAEVRIAHDQIYGPTNGWYPAQIVPASQVPPLPPSITPLSTPLGTQMQNAQTPLQRQNSRPIPPHKKKSHKKKIPPSLNLNEIPLAIRRLTTIETRQEIERVQILIGNLDQKLLDLKANKKVCALIR